MFMRKFLSVATGLSLALSLLAPAVSMAAVSVSVAPASLVTDPMSVKAVSAPLGVFSFTLTEDAGETLSSVSVLVAQSATTTVSGADLASVDLYMDNGNGTFESGADTLVGSQTSVNVGTNTTVTPATTTPHSGKFFVSLATGASWSDVAPGDKVTVTLPTDGIVSSLGAASTSPVTTAIISADTTAPTLNSAVAQNTGGTSAKEAGDSIALTFSEETNKPAITNANISSYLTLNNGHSFLDTLGNLGAASWNTAGTILTITLSGTSTPTSTLPSVLTGDVVTVVSSASFVDLAGNQAGGTQAITGSFAGQLPGDDDDEDDEEEVRGNCANSIINGRLYKVSSEPTVYLAAACRLKPFRGAAVFHARGKKFQDIIVLSSLPENVSVSQKPVLPVAGTLVKGKDKTVWFVDKHGKRKGFVSANIFVRLGFIFGNVQVISDTDLALIPVDQPVQENSEHPDGSVIKCSNQATVYQVVGGKKFPFGSMSALTGASQTLGNILIVNCNNFQYQQGAPIN